MSSSPRVHRSRHADRSPAAPARASWRVLAAALLGVAALGGGCGKFMIDDPAQGEHIGEGSAPVNCPPGFAECNGDPSDGCETSLSSLDSCGACGVVCAFAHASASCATGTCAFVACDAGFLDCNGDPADGCEPTPCGDGQLCGTGADCASGVCSGGVCQTASCTDAVKNGSETDVDCGGSCPPCVLPGSCTSTADCSGGKVCIAGQCQPPSCTDGIQDGDETAVDCGGSCAKPETCNGVDDDCNGMIDEGLGTITCGLGACQVTVPACAGGQAGVCVPGASQPESCNGIDDNCDGAIDESCPCLDGTIQPCYTGAPGSVGVGACHAGTQTCGQGQWSACTGEVKPSTEVCDGKDNDCNGQVDEGLAPISCGVGACLQIVPSCANGAPAVCTPGQPSAEICDGKDNDCNGNVDDGLAPLSCGVGACLQIVPSCANGAPQVCTPGQPSAEICDGKDNDCNGQVDDGNPGAGQPCNTGLLGSCAAGLTACAGGALSCAPVAAPSADVCDGLDNDCNGVVDNGLGDALASSCAGAASTTISVAPGDAPALTGILPQAGGSDFFHVEFTGVPAVGLSYHPKIVLADAAGGQYLLNVHSPGCAGSLCGNLSVWEMSFTYGGECQAQGDCADQSQRIASVDVEVLRIAGGATCQPYTIGITSEGPVCPASCAALDACHVAGVCDPQTGLCTNPVAADGTACNDGNPCTTVDTCQAGVCTGASPMVCAAADPCHVAGVCDPASGQCSTPNAPNGTACNDGNACTAADSCQAGVCTGASPVVCPAPAPCHVAGVCNPQSGQCSTPNAPDGTACNDGDPATQNDSCQNGACTGAANCSPTSAIAVDPEGSVPFGGALAQVGDSVYFSVTFNAVPGPGGYYHPKIELTGGAGEYAMDVQSAGCASSFCGDVATWEMSYPLDPVCQAQGSCTDDVPRVTYAVVQITRIAAGASPFATVSSNLGAPPGCPGACVALDACHVAGVCDVATGQCSNPVAPDGTACNDGNACTTLDTCQAGSCTGASPVVCGAPAACHVAGVCNPASGLCTNPVAPDGTACDDGDPATQNDSCQNGSCTGAAACSPSSGIAVAPGGSTPFGGSLAQVGDSLYFSVTFDAVPGAGGSYHPKIDLTGGAAEYAMDVQSAACASSLCGTIATWEMAYALDATCQAEGNCTDDVARVSYAVVKLTRVAAGASPFSTLSSNL